MANVNTHQRLICQQQITILAQIEQVLGIDGKSDL